MQKKLLLLFMAVNCVVAQAGEYNVNQSAGYVDELINQYTEALLSGKPGAIDSIYSNQKNQNELDKTKARSGQCNGRHLVQPDEECVTGQKYKEFDEEYIKKTKINDELFEGYKNSFDFAFEIDLKISIMTHIYLRGLEKCGKDRACLLANNNIRWEELSAGFIEQQCSPVYDAASYQGKIALTREQKEEIAQNNLEIKELVEKLNEAKQKVLNKIDSLKSGN